MTPPRLAAAALALLLALGAAGVAEAGAFVREDAADLPFEVEHTGTEFCAETESTAFYYTVRTHESDLAHLILGLSCDVETELVENPDNAWQYVVGERYTGLTGYRWLLGQDSNTVANYTLVLRGSIGTGAGVPYGVTMHGRAGVGAGGGPDCGAPHAYPTFGAAPSSDEVECGDPLADTPEGAADEVVPLPGECASNRRILRTVRLTGDGGLTTKQTSTVEVRDTLAPSMSHDDVNGTFECGTGPLPAMPDVTAVDACQGPVEVAFCEEEGEPRCPNERVVVRTWTAVDDCGNSACTTHTLRVVDTRPPVLEGVPENDQTVECDGDEHLDSIESVGVTASDLCGGDSPCWANPDEPLEMSQTRIDGHCHGHFAVERRWRAEDCCGNVATARQLVLVRDTTPPALSWDGGARPENVTLDRCDAVPDQPEASALDSCGNLEVRVTNTTTLLEDGGCPFSFRVHWLWEAVDDCGNAAQAATMVTVDDPRQPSWAGEVDDVRNVTVSCDAVPPAPDVRLETPCGEAATAYREWVNETDCPNEYTLWREWTGTWGCNKTMRLVQRVVVEDADAPEFDGGTVPAHDAAQCLADVDEHAGDVVALLPGPDECDNEANVSWSETLEPGSCTNRAVVRRHWSAVDCAGNEATVEQVITVHDDTKPVMEGLPDEIELVVHCHEVPPPRRVTALDNCDGEVTVQHEDVGRPAEGCSYNFTRRYSAADACGNEAVFEQLVVVQDGNAPQWLHPDSLPEDETLECGTPAQATLDAFDECADVEVRAWNETEASGVCDENYVVRYYWTAEDDCGNAATHNQTVRTADTVPPVADPNPPMCFFPVAHAPYHVVHNATRPNQFFSVRDECSALTVTIDACASDQDDHFDDLELGDPVAGFHSDCFYNASDDTLRFRVRFDWRVDEGRVFEVTGTATDACGNETPLRRDIWIPRDEESRRDGFDQAECGDVPLDCSGECPCGYNEYECAGAEMDAGITFHNVPAESGATNSTFRYTVGGDMMPSRVIVAVDLTRVQLLEVSPDSRVELGGQGDSYLSGVVWHTAGAPGTYSFTVAGVAAPEQPMAAQLLMADHSGMDAPCSKPADVLGPGEVQHPDGHVTVAGRVLVAGAAHGDLRDAGLPVPGAVVRLSPGGGAHSQLTMTDGEGRFEFSVAPLGSGAELSLETDGALRRPAGGRHWSRFVTADGATMVHPYGGPIGAAEGDGNDFELQLNTREWPAYEVASASGQFKGRPRSVHWWRHNAAVAKADAYGAASMPPADVFAACDYAGELLAGCGPTVAEMLETDADEPLQLLAAAALNHASGRGLFDPYRRTERYFVLYAKHALCRDPEDRTEADEQAATQALRRLLAAF